MHALLRKYMDRFLWNWSIHTKVVNSIDQTWYRNTFERLDMVLTDPIVENVYESKPQALRSTELKA